MSKYRTAYATEFRQQLIELVHAERSANDVAKEFALHATTVAKLRQVQMERDILPKSTAWFAGKNERASTASTGS